MKVSISGVLVTASHVHQTSPDEKGAMMRSSVIGNDFTKYENVPYVTANSVRGLIRRAAAHLVFEQMRKGGKQISKNLYLSIVRGSFGRKAINAGGATHEQVALARNHVFSGLFGGGANMYRSPVRLTKDLFPVLESIKNIFPNHVRNYAIKVGHRNILENLLMAPRDDFAKLTEDAREVVANASEAYRAHMAAKKDQSDKKAAEKEAGQAGSSDDLDNFAVTEAIIPGVPLYFGLATSNITSAQAGLLLQAVHLWVNDNALGGGSARGRGQFYPKLTLRIDGKLVTDSLFSGDEMGFEMAKSDVIDQCIDACSAALSSLNLVDDLATAYPSEEVDTKETRKAKKAAAKAEADKGE